MSKRICAKCKEAMPDGEGFGPWICETCKKQL